MTFEPLTVVLGSVKEGKIEHMPTIASLIPEAEAPIPKEDDCGILQMVRPGDFWEAAFQKTRSVFIACINVADCCPSSICFDGELGVSIREWRPLASDSSSLADPKDMRHRG